MARGPAQRTLTIYLINQGLTDPAVILRPGAEHHAVTVNRQHVGDLYVKVGDPHQPPWVRFFAETALNLTSVQGMSTSAVLLMSASRRVFAITFGFGRLLLQPGTTDDRFGLKVTLNAVDHNQIRSVDRETLDKFLKSGTETSGRDSRLPPSGTVLRRMFRGAAVEVKVLDNGFEYDGRIYRSLSAIASEVAGSHWNGFLFFGCGNGERDDA